MGSGLISTFSTANDKGIFLSPVNYLRSLVAEGNYVQSKIPFLDFDGREENKEFTSSTIDFYLYRNGIVRLNLIPQLKELKGGSVSRAFLLPLASQLCEPI